MGRLRTTTILAAATLCATAGLTFELQLSGGSTGVRLETTEGGELLVISVDRVRLESVDINGASWAVVQVPSSPNLIEKGQPSLPFLTAEYLLGESDHIVLEPVSTDVREVDLGAYGFAGVAPSKGHFSRSIDPATVPWTFDERTYSSSSPFPTATWSVDQPFIAGPLRGQALRLPVAFWTPSRNRLEVVETATFRVNRQAGGVNPRLRPQPPMTAPFAELAQRAVNASSGRPPAFVESGRALILAYDAFLEEVQPLADWQTLAGYPTLVTPLSAVGTTASQILNYIQGLYNEPEGLAWIILVGDYEQITNPAGVNEGAPCDACYTKLEGGDNRPDAAISRISAQTEAQVTVQVDKVLDYELHPDTGTAAAWYSRAFGIAGDDYGGGAADYERMDWLRNDLVTLAVEPTEPHYTYTEFDQIYHSPSPSDVATAVNAGRSLGLYIGHGAETYWVTSGFSVDNVNNDLSNGNALPVIWDVACVNGRFNRSGGDCFAEAWLKKEGGGAVSFEAATTNESWVPPCDAQRGIVDALRLETAFTTGGQHMTGKQVVMDVNGDTNSSEGTMWVEQSTLFGSCLTWMRTQTPQVPDEPLDFQMEGDAATLTVTVGGVPYAKANGAIVSFYTRDTGVTLLGSGLIDATGVVHATLAGSPTHCHIHGFNLVPQEYELAARPAGRVMLDAAAYRCDSPVTIRVVDSNVPAPATSVEVSLQAGTQTLPVTINDDGTGRGFYVGSITLGVDLVVAHGDTLTATYVDADDGAGGVSVPVTTTAAVDCAGPMITALEVHNVGATSAEVVWTTDEPADSYVEVQPGGVIATGTELGTAHSLLVEGLANCTTYTAAVTSVDALGNSASAGPSLPFKTLQQAIAFQDDVEDGNLGWTVETPADYDASPNWGIVVDAGASSPTHSWFTADEGGVKDDRLTVGPLTLGAGAATLSFWHHFVFEDSWSPWDGGVLELSTNGTTFVDVLAAGGVFVEGGYTGTIASGYSNPLAGREGWWGDSGGLVHTAVDLSALAGGQVWVRFRIGCDSMVSATGWWVDDVVVESTGSCPDPPMFGDGFETGDTSGWGDTLP